MNKLVFTLLLAFNSLIALAQACVYSEFTYTIGDNGLVTFEEISTDTHLVRWDWQFGDGAIGTGQKITHRYNITQSTDASVCFDVVLSVNDGANSGVRQPTQICIPTSTQSGGDKLYIKIINPIEDYDGVCNSPIAKIIAHQQTPFGANIFGGTPPYNCHWSFPSGTLPTREFVGKGPHIVTFPNVGTGLCPTQWVRLDVTDAKGRTDSSFVKISIRDVSELTVKMNVVANKLPICVGENALFTLKTNEYFAPKYNFSGVNPDARYRWFIDGKADNAVPSLDKINRIFTEGVHTVALEIKEGNYTYKPIPKRFNVRSLATCQDSLPDTPLSISSISTLPFKCSDAKYVFDITGNISGGMPYALDKNDSPINKNKAYKSVKWKGYYFNNPNREIIDFIKIIPNSEGRKAAVDVNHPYFKLFGAGEQILFIVEASVTDWADYEASYSMLAGFDAPLTITLPSEIYRCKSNDVALSQIPIVQGGKMPYTYEWRSSINIFKTQPDDNESPLLNLTDPSVKSLNAITLKVKDADGCTTEKTVNIRLRELAAFSLDTAVQIACNNNSSALTIGPTNCLPDNLAASLGGSGDYRFMWRANSQLEDNNISDPTVPYIKVTGDTTSPSIVEYNLTISDYYGHCAPQKATVLVKYSAANIKVDLGIDKVFCLDNPLIIKAKATIDAKQVTTGLVYKWAVEATDKIAATDLPPDSKYTYPVAPITEKSNQITVKDVLPNLKYTYKVTVVDPNSHCSATDEVVVESEKRWSYSGFESVIAPLLMGKKGALWASDNNHIFTTGEDSSKASKLINTLPISPQITDINYGNNGAINQGFFNPATDFNTKIDVINNNGNGCKKTFISNTFYTLERNPNIVVNTNKKEVFSGENLCLNLTLNTHVLSGNKYLPPSFKTIYRLKQAHLVADKEFDNKVNSGNIEFVLNDANTGIYKATTYIKLPFVKEITPFVFLIDDGLPNFKVTGDGYFKVDYRFDVVPINAPLNVNISQKATPNTPSNKGETEASKSNFTLYPSPFTHTITLNYDVKKEKGSLVNLTIYNGLGQIIDKIFHPHLHDFGVYSTTYNTDKLTTGLYFFELIVDGEKQVKKSIKVD